jgi:hypothetical protein
MGTFQTSYDINFLNIFTLIISSKLWYVVGILMFLKWFDVDCLDFQIELRCRYFKIVLAIFLNNWVIFSSLLVTFIDVECLTIFWHLCSWNSHALSIQNAQDDPIIFKNFWKLKAKCLRP